MTVPSTSRRVQYLGTGLVTVYPYTFRVFDQTHLVVKKTDENGTTQTLALGVDYTVSGVGSYNGGNVTLTTALLANNTLTIERVVPLTQTVDLRNQGAFFAETHEDLFDKVMMALQQQSEDGAGIVRFRSEDASSVNAELPAVQASRLIGTNSSATALEFYDFIDAGLAAAGNQTVDRYTAGSSFTAGVTTALTLTRDPVTKNATVVTFDGVVQHKSQYSVSGTTLTFTSPIPVGTLEVEVQTTTTIAVGVPSDGSVTTTKIEDGAVTVAKMATGLPFWGRILNDTALAMTASGTATIDRFHTISATSGNATITLPAASGNAGKVCGFHVLSTNTKRVTIIGSTPATSIDGDSSSHARVNMHKNGTLLLYCDGTNWYSIVRNLAPGVYVEASSNAGQVVTGTSESVDFEDEAFDTHAAWDAAGSFTAPASGIYQVNARVQGNGDARLMLYIDGALSVQGVNAYQAGTTRSTISAVVRLEAGQVLSFRMSDNVTLTSTATDNTLRIARVGDYA